MGSDEMVLLASRQPAKRKELDVSYLFLNFDQLTYCYIGICSYLVIALSCLILKCVSNSHYSSDQTIDFKAMIKHAYNWCWSIFELLVDQENHRLVGWSSRLLWSSYCIASFTLIFGFFTNLMSTEMVAFVKPPELDSFEDLYTPYFTPMNSLILTNLPSYGLIKQAKPGTKLSLLQQRLNRSPNSSSVHFDFNQLGAMFPHILSTSNDIKKGQLCVSTPDYMVAILRLAACGIDTEIWRSMYQSSSFGQGLLTTFYNKALPTHMVKFIDYKARNLNEMAIPRQLSLNAMQLTFNLKSPRPMDWKGFKCYHELIDEEDSVEKAAKFSLTLSALGRVFVYGCYAFGFAVVVLLTECVSGKVRNSLKYAKSKKVNEREKTVSQKWISMQMQLMGQQGTVQPKTGPPETVGLKSFQLIRNPPNVETHLTC